MNIQKEFSLHPSLDGFPLSFTRFQPVNSVPLATAIFVNATGVQGRFYHSFAEYLATIGVAAFTFDYRYSGRSFPPNLNLDEIYGDKEAYTEALRGCPSDTDLTNTWARKDLASMVDLATSSYPDVPLVLIGHSLGGHLMALLDPNHRQKVARYLALCSGNAYIGHTKFVGKARSAFLKNIVQPMMDAGPSRGTYRISALGMGFDLPYGPGIEWLRWAFHRYHSLNLPEDRQRARNIQGVPYLYVGFEDDESVTKHMSYEYLSCLDHSDGLKKSLWVNPRQRTPIWDSCGHINFFNKSRPLEDSVLSHEESVWKLLAGYILSGNIDAGDNELKTWKVEDERELVEDVENSTGSEEQQVKARM